MQIEMQIVIVSQLNYKCLIHQKPILLGVLVHIEEDMQKHSSPFSLFRVLHKTVDGAWVVFDQFQGLGISYTGRLRRTRWAPLE
jgi:hypothetical protein